MNATCTDFSYTKVNVDYLFIRLEPVCQFPVSVDDISAANEDLGHPMDRAITTGIIEFGNN